MGGGSDGEALVSAEAERGVAVRGPRVGRLEVARVLGPIGRSSVD